MRKTYYFIFVCIWAVIGCTTEPDQNKKTFFIVKIDSLNHTPFAAPGDTISIKLFGTVGTDGCHSFSRFEDIQQPLQLDLTVWGQKTSSEVCTAVMVYLNGKEFKSIAAKQGWYRINIHQPDGSFLKDSIIIK